MARPRSLLKGFARTIADAQPDASKRVVLFDPDARGLCVRITPKGRKTFTVVGRDPSGKQIWAALPNGDADAMPLETARELSREALIRIKAGEAAFPANTIPKRPDSFESIHAEFLKRHIDKLGLRSAPEIKRNFARYVLPVWRDRAFIEIRRADVAKLLDRIEDQNGPVQADRVLAALSKLFNWYQARDDDYVSPIVRGMRRAVASERARTRTLNDDDLRLAWRAMEQAGAFGALARMCLLTAQRKGKVAAMRWDDVNGDGVWSIPTEAREKGNAGQLKLPPAARSILRSQSRIGKNPYVFASAKSDGPISGLSPMKRALDKQILAIQRGQAVEQGRDPESVEPIEAWTLHDLRRTARSLMARANVRPDVAERVLGHVIPGVEGVYDRYAYFDEKADALARLESLLETILEPAHGNVVALREKA